MKLDNHISDDKKEKVEISVQKKQEVEKFLFAGILKPKPNQRVFKLNLSTLEVSEVEFLIKSDTIQYEDVINNAHSLKERDILIEEGFDYVIKLNMTNAINHFLMKWRKVDIKASSEHTANRLMKNQRKVNKYKNK